MRKGENIHQRKDGRFEARYFDKAQNKYVSVYSNTYSDVKRKRFERISTVELAKTTITPKTQTFHELCNEWLNYKRLTVKISTYSKYYDIVNNHLLSAFGKLEIEKITQEMIDTFIVEKLNSNLSYKTVKDICSVLNQILKKKKIDFCYSVKSSQRVNEVVIFSTDESLRFINYLLNDIDCTKLAILISLFAGLRIGELCGLKWKHISLEKRTIKIVDNLQRIRNPDKNSDKKTVIIIDTPKTKNAERTIPINEILFNILFSMKKSDDCFVATGTKRYTEPRTLDRKFKKHLKNCCITENRFHALRHTFATQCIASGIDYKTVSEFLGHAEAKFTMTRYVHPDIEQKKRQIEKLNYNF